jgi:hypothetical protein
MNIPYGTVDKPADTALAGSYSPLKTPALLREMYGCDYPNKERIAARILCNLFVMAKISKDEGIWIMLISFRL